MHLSRPFVRESGHGEAVVCLHASTSSSKQWVPLIERLAWQRRVLAPDLAGQGRTALQEPRRNALDEDMAVVEAVAGGQAVHLVGHSYGGAVALRYAVRHPHRVRSLTLYEPAVWHILADEPVADQAALRLFDVAQRIVCLVEDGDPVEAARLFVDYWNGADSFDGMGASQRERIAAQMTRVVAHFEALLADRTRLAAYAGLGMPTLLISGGAGPRSGQGTTELLAAAMPRALTRRFPALGHMGPVVSPHEVNEAICGLIAGIAETASKHPVAAPYTRHPSLQALSQWK